MWSGAVHPELPPRGGAASSVEEKQRVCPELPDQGIRPESAIPREPPAKPRWAGVLSPREPCSPKVPLHEGVPNTPSLSFQSWFPLIDVQRPGQSPGPLPGWGPPPGSCPAPRLAHLFRGVIGIIGLWRTQGCHLPLGSIWDTGKAGQHGPCALIPRARDLRGASWEQSGHRADRCHCGDLEGGLRVTMPGDL